MSGPDGKKYLHSMTGLQSVEYTKESVEALLQRNEKADLLRIATAGSVDDGKSTLIGRLLYEAKGIFEDQLASIRDYSRTHSRGEFDYSLVTDGLKAEREQGITIDVAYRYFSTPKRRFIIADTPGHEQYTRNMATGASTAQLALILVDAVNGVGVQTRRHAFISSLLGIRHLVLAVNKMDLVGYEESVFEKIVAVCRLFADKLPVDSLHFIPLSALQGDNVVEKSDRMPWYKGAPLLDYLENVVVLGERNLRDFRFPVQRVVWTGKTFRGYAGTIASGVVRAGDEIFVLPSGVTSRVKRIAAWDVDKQYAFAPQAVVVELEDDVDISRGDMIARPKNLPTLTDEVEASLVWMNEKPLRPGGTYLFKHCSRYVKGTVTALKYRLDPRDLHRKEAEEFRLNEIGRAFVSFVKPLYADEYRDNAATGAFIVVDPVSNLTVGAGMIERCMTHLSINTEGAEKQKEAKTFWLPLDTPEEEIEHILHEHRPVMRLDWEDLEKGLNADLSEAQVDEKIRRIHHVCELGNASGVSVILLCFPFPPDERFRKQLGENPWFGDIS